VQTLLTGIINECAPIIFNGDGYSAEWHAEAATRGLLNLATSADALPGLHTPKNTTLFDTYGVLSDRELESRQEIYLEQYCQTVTVEANLTLEIGRTLIFPAAIRYQNLLASTCANLKAVGYDFDTDTLDRVTLLVKSLQDSLGVLERTMGGAPSGTLVDDARRCCDVVLPAMNTVREYADALEGLVADDLWPLPTYQEMLFVK
jgi:glutamine synthetase